MKLEPYNLFKKKREGVEIFFVKGIMDIVKDLIFYMIGFAFFVYFSAGANAFLINLEQQEKVSLSTDWWIPAGLFVLFLGVAIKIGLNFIRDMKGLVIRLHLYNSKISSYLLEFIPLQTIRNSEIKSIDIYQRKVKYIYIVQKKIVEAKDIDDSDNVVPNNFFFGKYRLRLNLKNGQSKVLKFGMRTFRDAQYIKEQILEPKSKVEEKETEQNIKIKSVTNAHALVLYAEYFDFDIKFFLICLFATAGLLMWPRSMITPLHLTLVPLSIRIVKDVIKLYSIFKIKQIDITKNYIKEHRIGLPFWNTFFVQKKNIELLTLSEHNNKYIITVVATNSKINRLAINFGTLEEAKEYLMKIKERLRIEDVEILIN